MTTDNITFAISLEQEEYYLEEEIIKIAEDMGIIKEGSKLCGPYKDIKEYKQIYFVFPKEWGSQVSRKFDQTLQKKLNIFIQII